MKLQNIQLSKLVTSQLNARRSVSKSGIEELKASILAHGLMQNLVVVPTPDDKFEVIAGGRRREALQQLQQEGKLPKDYAVPCEVASAANAAEMSLAENVVREVMHPLDEFEAFNDLATRKQAPLKPAEIAPRFGCTEKHVEQRLRLARVAPEIREAYRAGKISLDVLMAYTLSGDHNAQKKAYKAAGSNQSARYVRQLLTEKLESSTDRLCKFVTLKAYRDAGGKIREDLFSSHFNKDEEVLLEDVQLLHKLALEKLEIEAAKLKKEGWGWVECKVEADYGYTSQFGHSDAKTKEQKALAGCLATIGWSGKVDISKGLVRKQDAKKLAAAAGDKKPAKKNKAAMSQTLRKNMEGYRQQIMRLALSSQSLLALDYLIYGIISQSKTVLKFGKQPASRNMYSHFEDNKVSVGHISFGETVTVTNPKEETSARKALKLLHEKLPVSWAELKTEEEKFTAFAKLTQDEKLRLLAAAIGMTVKPELSIDRYDDKLKKDDLLELILSRSGVDVSHHWRPTKDNYLNSITSAQLRDIGTELFGKKWATQWSTAKKTALVSELDKIFSSPAKYAAGDKQIEQNIRAWLPKGMAINATPAKAEKPKVQKRAA